MTHDVEQQLLQFHNFRSNAAARPPPLIGIEQRIAGGTNRHSSLVALNRTMKHSAQAARVIASAHHHDRVKPLLIAPASKYRAFVLCARYVCWNLLDIRKPQRPQCSYIPGGLIRVWDTATGELSFHSIPSIGEDGDSRSYSAVNEIGSFEYTRSIGFARNDNNVGGPVTLIDNERPPSRPQNRMSNRRYRNDCNGQKHQHQRD